MRSALFLLFAFGGIVAAQTTPSVEPNAGSWKTWVLASGSELRVPPPPNAAGTAQDIAVLKAYIAYRNPESTEQIHYWNAGPPSYRWIDQASLLINQGRLGTVPIARLWGYLTTAIYDATIACWDSKYAYNRPSPSEVDRSVVPLVSVPRSPSYPSEHACTAGAASSVLAFLFPQDDQHYRDLGEEAARSRLFAGLNYPSDTVAGLELGRAVAARVIERARTDGFGAPWTGTVPTGPGFWTGANPGGVTDRYWRTFVLSSGSEFRPGPPPAYNSPKMAEELAEVKNYPRGVANLNTNAAAFFWQSTAGNASYWWSVANQKVLEYRLDNNAPRAARVYALLGVGVYDTWVASQDGKFEYWQIRPNQLDPSITTLYPTPNFPSYPSNAAVLSATAGELMSYLFPAEAGAFREKALEAGYSRIWGGIHFRSDLDAGVSMGKAIGAKIVARTQTDGSQ